MSSRERRDEKRCTSQRFLLILYQSKGCINYVRESHPCLSEPPHVSLPLCPSEGTSSIVTFGEERLKRKHCPSLLSFPPSFFVHTRTLLCQFHAGPPAGRNTLLSPLQGPRGVGVASHNAVKKCPLYSMLQSKSFEGLSLH